MGPEISGEYRWASEGTHELLSSLEHPYEPLSSGEPSTVNLRAAMDGHMKGQTPKPSSSHQYSVLTSGETSLSNTPSQSSGQVSPEHTQRSAVPLSTSSDYQDAEGSLIKHPTVGQPSSMFELQVPIHTWPSPVRSRDNSLDTLMRYTPAAEAADPFSDLLDAKSSESLHWQFASETRSGSTNSFHDADHRYDLSVDLKPKKDSSVVNSNVSVSGGNRIHNKNASQQSEIRAKLLTHSDWSQKHSSSQTTSSASFHSVDSNPNGPVRNTNYRFVRDDELPKYPPPLFGSYPTRHQSSGDNFGDTSQRAGSHRKDPSVSQEYFETKGTFGSISTDIGDVSLPYGHSSIPLTVLDGEKRRKDRSRTDTSGENASGQWGFEKEAQKLVKEHLKIAFPDFGDQLVSVLVTPPNEPNDGRQRGQLQYRRGILPTLLQLYQPPNQVDDDATDDSNTSTGSPKTGFPKTIPHTRPKWFDRRPMGIARVRAQSIPAMGIFGPQGTTNARRGRVKSSRFENEIHITIHIADILSRRQYLIQMCQALMAYGNPPHRLEEHMRMSARVLEVDAQFFYVPGCMIISFNDALTVTSEVKMVRTSQSVDLARLADVQEVYKLVLHDKTDVESAMIKLEEISQAERKYGEWFVVIIYGLASAFVAPFGFHGAWIDMPAAFFLGTILGFLHVIVAPKSELHSNVVEMLAVVLTSFLARAFGSIRKNDDPVLCFPALAKSAVCILLPGYVVLCASLELQSRSMVSGSVRMIYAMTYSFLLGICITVGTDIWELKEHPDISWACEYPMPRWYSFVAVVPFTVCCAIINGARWRQMPLMACIAFVGYGVSYWTSTLSGTTFQVGPACGAFVVGLLGNFCSRLLHVCAAAVIMPAIFMLVPNALAGVHTLSRETADTHSLDLTLQIGFGMVTIAIAISIGLLLSGIVCYPCGKRRSGLFSF